MGRVRLTTVDNPYDPFEQFTSWFLFDEENNREEERAIDEIIKYDFRNIYRKVREKAATV